MEGFKRTHVCIENGYLRVSVRPFARNHVICSLLENQYNVSSSKVILMPQLPEAKVIFFAFMGHFCLWKSKDGIEGLASNG